METRSVSFSVGLDACRVRPGSIFRVADQHLAGRRIGGRIRTATATAVTVDAELGVRPGDRLTVNLPSGVSETRIISTAVGQGLTADMTTFTVDSTELTADMVGLPGTVLILTVTAPFSEVPEAECVWTLESEDLSAQRFRVLKIRRTGGLTAEIAAIQHEPGKFENVDFGTRLDPAPITVIPPGIQPPPSDVTITSYSVIDQGYASHTAVFSWKPAASAVAYEVQWRRDNSEWVNLPRTGSTSIEVPNIYAGGFLCRVRALNALDIASIWASSTLTQLDGILAPPPAVTSLTATALVFAIRLKWGLPTSPSIIERTEIWYSQTPAFTTAQKLGDFAFPQDTTTLMGLSAGARLYFWAILRDRNGVAGERYPAGNGVLGQSSSDASEILDYLNGKITSTQLAKDLLAPIQEIPGLKTTVQEVDGKVNTLGTALNLEREERIEQGEAFSREVSTVGATATAAKATAGQALDKANATEGEVETISAVVEETKTAIAKTNGYLEATWSVKAQMSSGGKYYMAGIALGVDNSSGVAESKVLVAADLFAVMHPNGTDVVSPFVITGGQVFMSDAFIGNGSITNAKIGSYIQSDNYQPGVSGWRIDKTGTFEINGSNGGGRLLISPGLMRVYDGNGVLRVRVGNW
jgi:predicted phage tail protein